MPKQSKPLHPARIELLARLGTHGTLFERDAASVSLGRAMARDGLLSRLAGGGGRLTTLSLTDEGRKALEQLSEQQRRCPCIRCNRSPS